MTDQICGVVNLYKEKGYTSQDAIRVLQGILHASKIGHTGTLDPDAVGVLPVCIGKATRCAEIITGAEKAYRAEVTFGVETDTQDASGKVLRTFSYTVNEEEVRKVCASMVGTYEQVPPMYSALKFHGRKLYELARQGIEVDRKPRPVTIHELTIREIRKDGMTIDVRCSKGTYIRSLCEDIGKKLGYGACMQSLIRTASGPYRVEDAHTLEEIKAMQEKGETEKFLVSLDTLFRDLPDLTVSAEEDRYLKSGNFLTYPSSRIDGNEGSMVCMRLSDGSLAAVYRIAEHLEQEGLPYTRLRAFKMFV